jgi:SOS regulatory protein LexA
MLTKKQKQVLDFVEKYRNKKKYSPSLEEIKKHFKLASVSTAHFHIKRLQESGYLQKEKNQPRAIDICKKEKMITIPLLGLIAAGEPIEAIEEYENLTVPENNISKFGKHFALRVQGNSMIQEGIFDGDHVIIRKQNTAENGDTIVALINGNEATLKKIFRIKNGFELQPANPTLKSFTVKELIVQGKVISVMRNYEAKRNINQKINFISFTNELKSLITETQSQILEKFSINKEYNIWKQTEDNPNKEKFCLETAYTFFNELFLLWVCRDKGLLKFETISNYQDSVKLKKEAQKIYSHVFENNIFDWYYPNDFILQQITNSFNKYDFSEIDRDVLGKLYEQFISSEERKKLGQFYTPETIIDYILNQIGYTDKQNIANKKIIDISCGSGGFITRAAFCLITHLKNKKYKPKEIIKKITDNIYGLDINPFACYLAETNILLQFLDLIAEAKERDKNYSIPKINIFQTNTIETPNLLNKDLPIVKEIKNKTGKFAQGFDFVVGNPPYLEAKKMDKITKKLCAETCPNIINGAFDLFICFIDKGMRLLKTNGKFGYIIPNKFLIANYAKKMRTKILNQYSIREIIDVSECEVFENVSVYPVILLIENKTSTNNTITETAEKISSKQELESHNFAKCKIKQNIYKRDDFIFFLLPTDEKKQSLLLKLLSNQYKTLDNYLAIKWTISFHIDGLRNQFIFDKKPKSEFAKKLIGGKSFSGNQEIKRYKLNWKEWWIDYNQKLAKKHNNCLPPKNIFENEKIIICQNALRLRAAYDEKGFFCKDTFFVAYLNEKNKEKFHLKFFLAILNSKLLHYYYANIYKGTHIAGGYLHYLIVYLNSMPIAKPTKKQQSDIVVLVDKVLKAKDEKKFAKIDKAIDNKIYKLYNMNKEEIEIVENFI